MCGPVTTSSVHSIGSPLRRRSHSCGWKPRKTSTQFTAGPLHPPHAFACIDEVTAAKARKNRRSHPAPCMSRTAHRLPQRPDSANTRKPHRYIAGRIAGSHSRRIASRKVCPRPRRRPIGRLTAFVSRPKEASPEITACVASPNLAAPAIIDKATQHAATSRNLVCSSRNLSFCSCSCR